MFKCSKTYNVEYAHQLYTSYTELCHETIHGHSGKIVIEFVSVDNTLNEDDMVIDFGEVSSIIKKHIMDKYDHALFMPKMFHKSYLNALGKYNNRLTITDCNPTAEMFARWIFEECDKLLEQNGVEDVRVSKVEFWETSTGKAEYINEKLLY